MSRPSRSKAHGFSAFSTALGVALTLGVLGTLVVGAMVVRELRTDWLASMTVQVVLEEGAGGSRMAADWLGEEGVQSAVYIDADSASAEMERELGEDRQAQGGRGERVHHDPSIRAAKPTTAQ